MSTSNTPLETWSVSIDADSGPLQEELRSATTAGRQFSSALITAFEGVAVKGKSLGDVVDTLALSLSKITLKAAFKPLEEGLGSIITNLISGGAGGGFSGFANGAAFVGGMPTPFASGGVIQSPVTFPLGSGRTGLAGERGAEAIMPLARGPDGRLGVAASGAGGPGVAVTFNVQATDADSFMRSQSQVAAMLSRAVSLGQRNL
jgi:phage-related minor tail protein